MVGNPRTPALLEGPFALFLDVDGTLVDIAPRPDAVVVPSELTRALATLDPQLGGALALVSGRTIADLDVLFAPLRLRASGIHGAEIRFVSGADVTGRPNCKLAADLIGRLHELAGAHRDTLVEDKGYSVAIHYRANPAAGPHLREALTRLAADAGLQILPGHMVFEAKGAEFDKGSAIAAFMGRAPFADRRPVFIGDDVTDLPGFETVLAAGGLAFSVTTRRTGLSGHFANPQDVRTWLTALAAQSA